MLEPASGSVIAKAKLRRPLPMPRSQRSFCASLPCRVKIVPAIPGETSSGSSGQPAALISSSTTRQLEEPEPAAVVLGRHVDAEEAVLGQRVPELLRRAVLLRTAAANARWP